jgi:hypothetical protein
VIVTPIHEISRRLPQAGRIRLGKPPAKGSKNPTALSKFRFSSPSRELLVKVAELYGGEVKAWTEPKTNDRFEVYSDASEIRVVLAPDPFHAAYELWKGAVNVRRCDGLTCVVTVPGQDGPEQIERDCLCAERGMLECAPTLRLNVILPEVRGLGVWRLDTKSKNALHEMPAVVEGLQTLDGGRSMVEAVLRIEQRHDVIETRKGKQRRNFVVPVLDFAASLDEMIAGQHRVSIGSGPTFPESTAGVVPPSGEAFGALPPGGDAIESRLERIAETYAPGADTDIVDAEVVEEPTDVMRGVVETWAAGLDPRERNFILRQARDVAAEMGQPLPVNFAGIPETILQRIYDLLEEP